MPLSSAVQTELVGDEKREHWMTDSAPSLRNSLGYGLKASGHTQAGLASSSPLLVLHSIRWKKEMPYFSKLQEKAKERGKKQACALISSDQTLL